MFVIIAIELAFILLVLCRYVYKVPKVTTSWM